MGETAGYSEAIDRLSVWAARYAMGRMTYAVADVVDTLIVSRRALAPHTRAVIVKDIEERLESGRLGMPMDERKWIELRDALGSE